MNTTETNTPSSDAAPEDGQARTWTERMLNRRSMLRAAGLAGAGVALAACSNENAFTSLIAPKISADVQTNATYVLDFATDIGVLNYAYALEQLEAAFYAQVVTSANFSTLYSVSEQRVLSDLRDHEIVHREFLKTALASAAIGPLTVNFSSIDFTSRTSVLTTARTFEDLGVGAYNGAAKYIASAAYLGVAGKIVSVEARHAAAIRDLIANRTGAFAPDNFDPAFDPNFVLTQAKSFVVDTISAINT